MVPNLEPEGSALFTINLLAVAVPDGVPERGHHRRRTVVTDCQRDTARAEYQLHNELLTGADLRQS